MYQLPVQLRVLCVTHIRWYCFLRNVELYLGIYTGILDCVVKLPEEVCVSHTKRVGDNKKVLQLK